jgi:hypothetical protein
LTHEPASESSNVTLRRSTESYRGGSARLCSVLNAIRIFGGANMILDS